MLQRPPGASHTKLKELQFDRLEYLFDPLDPFPTPARALSRGAEDFIVGWARELPQNAPIGLRLQLRDEEASTIDVAALKGAISRHFNYKADRADGDKNEFLAIGRVALVIGICVLGVCMVARQIVLGALPGSSISGVLGEGFVIVGWVANWRPIEIFPCEWWPMTRTRRLYERPAIAELDIVPPRGIGVSPTG
jgi:hypothetical protein